jgi:ribosomal-protein-alanine N-acetyltransferase
MSVVAATAADAEAMAALHRQCFADAWDAAAITALFANPAVFGFAVSGHAFILARAAAGEAEILTLATAPPARRRGYARELVITAAANAVGRGAVELFLEVAADNAPAIGLYSALGFVPVGRRPGYYRRGPVAADALTLRATLPLSQSAPADIDDGAGPRA